MSVRVARARAVVATGRTCAVVARVARVSRQALYRAPMRRSSVAGPGRGRPGDDAIVEVAKRNPTDGTRMVAALTSRELGTPVNRKRVQRVMHAHRLLQRSRNSDRRRRPGYFRVTRLNELWHVDMTKVWTAQHGWIRDPESQAFIESWFGQFKKRCAWRAEWESSSRPARRSGSTSTTTTGRTPASATVKSRGVVFDG